METWSLAKKGGGGGGSSASAGRTTTPRESDPYVIRLTPKPVPVAKDADHVVVRVLASALNHRDNWITMGMYPGLREGVTLGADACAELPGGDHKKVVIDPSLGWGADPAAPKGPSLEILGMPRDGSFATHLLVPKANVYPKPAHLTDVQAAALPLAGVTAYRALVTKGKAKAGDQVLVCGIGGGVAVFAVQFAVALGCKVFVTSSSQDKIDHACHALGANGGALYTENGWPKKLLAATEGRKFDCVVDGGGGDTLGEMLRVVKGGARIVTYGSTAGPKVELVLPQMFLNQVELLGTSMGSPQDFKDMLALVNAKKIVPLVDKVFAFHDFPLALDRMREGKQTGKLVLVHNHVGGTKL